MGKLPLWFIYLNVVFYRERIWDNYQCTWQRIVMNVVEGVVKGCHKRGLSHMHECETYCICRSSTCTDAEEITIGLGDTIGGEKERG